MAVYIGTEEDDDIIATTAEYNEIYGLAGNDRLRGNIHTDLIYGGDGNDTILGEEGDDVLLGEDGDDTIEGWLGDDLIFGGSGYDIIRAGRGRDYIEDFEGNSWIDAGGDDDVVLAWGRIGGGTGNDIIVVLHASEVTGDFDNDTIIGSDEADILYGDGIEQYPYFGHDVVLGGDGNDRIFGGHGSDYLAGGEGDDYLRADYSYPTDDGDTVLGEGGNDIIESSGADYLYGGAGKDQIFAGSGYIPRIGAVITGGTDADRVELHDGFSFEVLRFAQGDVTTVPSTAHLDIVSEFKDGEDVFMFEGVNPAWFTFSNLNLTTADSTLADIMALNQTPNSVLSVNLDNASQGNLVNLGEFGINAERGDKVLVIATEEVQHLLFLSDTNLILDAADFIAFA